METRDKNVIDFINLVDLATRDHIQKLYFKDVHENICMRILKKLTEREYINRFKHEGNTFVYYSEKRPAKRIINHDLYITDVVVNMILEGYEILDFKKSFVIGPIISDAYIKYKTKEGKIRHLVLEIQLHNKVEDCVLKYKGFKNIILDAELNWETIPRILVITDMTKRVELRGIKVMYDTTELKNINHVLRG